MLHRVAGLAAWTLLGVEQLADVLDIEEAGEEHGHPGAGKVSILHNNC